MKAAKNSTSKELALVFAALHRANNSGHAMFESKELENILNVTGKNSVMRIIKRVIITGLISPNSTPRCIWIDSNFISRRRWNGKSLYCEVHKTKSKTDKPTAKTKDATVYDINSGYQVDPQTGEIL
jgi:hypothetical protein